VRRLGDDQDAALKAQREGRLGFAVPVSAFGLGAIELAVGGTDGDAVAIARAVGVIARAGGMTRVARDASLNRKNPHK